MGHAKTTIQANLSLRGKIRWDRRTRGPFHSLSEQGLDSCRGGAEGSSDRHALQSLALLGRIAQFRSKEKYRGRLQGVLKAACATLTGVTIGRWIFGRVECGYGVGLAVKGLWIVV